MGRFSSLIRFLPGFRSTGHPIRKILASVSYGFTILIALALMFGPPTFTLASNQISSNSDTARISGHATDPNSEILLIQNGQTIAKAKPDPQSKDFYLDLTSLSSGTHTYSVMACSQKKSDNCSSRQPVTVTVGSVAGATSTPAAATSPTPTPANLVQITNVIDGDTVRLSINKVVRLIGIDTPEIHLER